MRGTIYRAREWNRAREWIVPVNPMHGYLSFAMFAFVSLDMDARIIHHVSFNAA